MTSGLPAAPERRAGASCDAYCPVTVAGPRRFLTGLPLTTGLCSPEFTPAGRPRRAPSSRTLRHAAGAARRPRHRLAHPAELPVLDLDQTQLTCHRHRHRALLLLEQPLLARGVTGTKVGEAACRPARPSPGPLRSRRSSLRIRPPWGPHFGVEIPQPWRTSPPISRPHLRRRRIAESSSAD